MNDNKDYYGILGITPFAEDVVIRAAYRALAQRYHPDKFEGSKNEATFKMAEINEAYSILSNPNKRRDYDAGRHQPSNQSSQSNNTYTSNQPEQNQDFAVPETSFIKKISDNVKNLPFGVSFFGVSLFLIFIVLKALSSVLSIS